MIRLASQELRDIGQGLCDTSDYLGDIIDGDTFGEIGNGNAQVALNSLRSRFRSYGLAVLYYIEKIESEAQDA